MGRGELADGHTAINKSAKHLPSHTAGGKTGFPATHSAWGLLGEQGGRVRGGRGTEDAGLSGPRTGRQAAGSDSPFALLAAHEGHWPVAPAGVTGTATWRDSVLCRDRWPQAGRLLQRGPRARAGPGDPGPAEACRQLCLSRGPRPSPFLLLCCRDPASWREHSFASLLVPGPHHPPSKAAAE